MHHRQGLNLEQPVVWYGVVAAAAAAAASAVARYDAAASTANFAAVADFGTAAADFGTAATAAVAHHSIPAAAVADFEADSSGLPYQVSDWACGLHTVAGLHTVGGDDGCGVLRV